MSSIIIAVIAALGSSGLAAALVSWWKDRDKDDAEVTDMIRKMSKEAVADARSELAELKADNRALRDDVRELKCCLNELSSLIEFEVLPLLQDHPVTVERLRSVTRRAG